MYGESQYHCFFKQVFSTYGFQCGLDNVWPMFPEASEMRAVAEEKILWTKVSASPSIRLSKAFASGSRYWDGGREAATRCREDRVVHAPWTALCLLSELAAPRCDWIRCSIPAAEDSMSGLNGKWMPVMTEADGALVKVPEVISPSPWRAEHN